MLSNVEKRWVTNSSLEAIVVTHPSLGHRCGYVRVPEDNGLYQISYEDINDSISVHGGLTFSGQLPKDIDPTLSYWLGYDCAHSCDRSRFNPQGIERTLDYCIEECEHLASQIHDSPLSLFYLAKKLGKLSEEQHNKMLAFGIEDSNNTFVRDYIELKSSAKS